MAASRRGPSAAHATNTATHIHASSIAVPSTSTIVQLESQLTSISKRVSPFLQRDVVLSRVDDNDPRRIEMEVNDSSFAPIRRARLQSRLLVRLQDSQAELRAYSQAQGSGGGINRDSEIVNVKNLVCSQLEGDYSASSRAALEEISEKRGMPQEISGSRQAWQQVTSAMGWIPQYSIIRSGQCFTIRQDASMLTNVYLFQLLQTDEEGALQLVSDTRILQAIVLITLPTKQDHGGPDMANLSERAVGEIVRLQDALRGLVDLSRDVD